MGIVSAFYAAFGYLALLAAILWGMLFVGDGVEAPLMDASAAAPPLAAILADLGMLLLLMLLHRLLGRGMLRHVTGWSVPRALERSTQAWAAALVLVVIYSGWRSLPQPLWSASGPLQGAFSGLSYVAWTLILIGAFLPTGAVGKTGLTATLGQPLYVGMLMALWTPSAMTVGHLLLATTTTAYLLFDGIWQARRARDGREPHHAFSFQGKRVTG